MIEKLQLLAQSWQLWGGAAAAGVIVGVVAGFLGVYVVLHRIVFVSAAMSEVSGLGVMIAFWLVQVEAVGAPDRSHPGGGYEDVLPLLFAAVFTGVFSAALAGRSLAKIADRSKSAEGLIGAVYLISAAGLLIVGDRVSQGAHDVANVLFGNAVVVDFAHLLLLAGVCVPIFLLHAWLKKDILFVSYDPAMARTLGYPVAALRIFLLVSLGMVISVGTRTMGALPVFSFSVLPALACLAVFEDLRWSFWAAACVGGLSALLGYLGSFLFSYPTGACMTMAAGGFLGLGYLVRLLRSK